MGKNKPQPSYGPIAKSVDVVQYKQRSGPLPTPEELEAYNRIIQNGADRIIKLAESQSAHRIEIEKHVVFSQQSQAVRGQYFGLFAVIIAIACSTYAAVSGKETFACILGGTTVLGLAGAFISGRYLQKKDLANKAKATPELSPQK